MNDVEYLPGTGRGTMRSMVEGFHFSANAPSIESGDPSTTFGGPPPRSGEVL